MATTFKERIAQAVSGELVEDWGVVSDRKPGFFRERICLSLRDQDGQLALVLTYKNSSVINYNVFAFQIPVFDLAAFVHPLQSSYDHLQVLAGSPQATVSGGPDNLPLAQRLMLKVIHGVRASRLLLDHQNPKTGETEYRFHGYVTRKSEIRVFIQSNLDISLSHAHVISGEGFEAALTVLSEYLHQNTFGQLAGR